MREYIVVVKDGVDLTSVDAELASDSGTIPRVVECCDPCEHDTRMTHWMLTDEEAQTLRQDDRILGVEIPFDQDDTGIVVEDARQINHTYTKHNDPNLGVNWALRRCSEKTDTIFNTVFNAGGEYHYALDGTGVDIVIMDSGIQADHPQFFDANGVSRVKQIDWYAASNGAVSGTMPANFYTDTTSHGTFCAGIAASLDYGWSKNADIYIMSMTDFNANGISSTTGYDLIRHWHNNKGTGRPTIVNMSYSNRWNGFSNTTTGDNGKHWNKVTEQFDTWTFGDANYETANEVRYEVDLWPTALPPRRFASVDAKIDQLIDAGIHVVVAANNAYALQFKDTAETDHNYNDWFKRPGFNLDLECHYHRGSSPRTSNNGAEIVVGSIATDYQSDKEQIARSSGCGEGIDIWAPGEHITSTVITTGASGSYNAIIDYRSSAPLSTAFKQGNNSGTSFAAPQVVGLMGLYLQLFPNLTPLELKNKIIHDAQDGQLHDNIGWDSSANQKYLTMTTSKGLYGSPNKFLYNKYHGDIIAKIGG